MAVAEASSSESAPRKLRLIIAAAVLVLVCMVAALQYYTTGLHPIYSVYRPHTLAALVRYSAGDLAGTARSLRAHLRLYPYHDWQNDDPAYAALLAGDLEAAEEAAREALRQDPQATRAAITLAQVLVERKKDNEALAVLQAALEHFPDRPVNSLALAAVLQTRLGNYDQAIPTWHRALRYDTPGTRLLIYVSVLETVADLERAADRPGREALLAQSWRYLRLYDRSADRFVRRHATRAIAANDRADDGQIALGTVLLHDGEQMAALEAFERATGINRRNAEAWRELALARSRRGDLPAEFDAALRAHDADPSDLFITEWLFNILAEKFGDHRKVVALARSRLAGGRLEYPVLLALGRAHAFLGELQSSTQAYDLALKTRPKDARLLLTISENYWKSENAASALDYARRAAAADPSWPEPLGMIAMLLTNQFRYAEAIEAYETAFRLGRPSINSVAHLCTLYHSVGRWQEGLECFETVLKLDPGNVLAGRMITEAQNNAALARRAATGAQAK